MRDDGLGLTVVFNGCIYNHRELRAELERAGHAFRSTSDTEVLLKGWAQWGEGMLERLAGMFAFCLVEERTGRVVLARDRLGVKPLYLADLPGGGLRAASTLPALVRAGGVDTRVDPVALHHYLSWHSIVPAPRTILRGVRKLAPATVLVVEPDGTRRERRWWDPPFARDRDWAPRGVGGGGRRRAAHRRAPADGRRRAGRDPALRRPRLEPDRRPARRAGPARPGDVLDRLPGRRRPRGRRVRVLGPRGARVRHRAPPDPRRARAGAGGAAGRRSARCPSRWSRTTRWRSGCCPRRSRASARSCSRARAPTRCSAATTGTRRCSRRPATGSTPTPARSSTAGTQDIAALRRARVGARRGPVARLRRRALRPAGRRAARSTAGCGSTPR